MSSSLQTSFQLLAAGIQKPAEMGIALYCFPYDPVSLGPGYAVILLAQAALDLMFHGNTVKRFLGHGRITSHGLKIRMGL
jgi:hypothetical protein